MSHDNDFPENHDAQQDTNHCGFLHAIPFFSIKLDHIQSYHPLPYTIIHFLPNFKREMKVIFMFKSFYN